MKERFTGQAVVGDGFVAGFVEEGDPDQDAVAEQYRLSLDVGSQDRRGVIAGVALVDVDGTAMPLRRASITEQIEEEHREFAKLERQVERIHDQMAATPIATSCSWEHQRRPQRTNRSRVTRRASAKSGSRGDPDLGDDDPPKPRAAAEGRVDDSGLNRVLQVAFAELEQPFEYFQAAAIIQRRGELKGGGR